MNSDQTDFDHLDFELLFNSLPDAYIAFLPNDPAFTIVAENKSHAEVALASHGDAIGKDIFEAFPDTSEKYKTTGVSDLLESFRRVIATGKPDTMPTLKYDVPDDNGNFVEKWWRVTHYPVFDARGTLVLLYQSTNDITEEIQVSQQLELAQSQLDSALGIGLVSTWSWDLKRDLVIGDRNLANNFGVKPELAAKGVPLSMFTDSIHEDDRPRVVSAILHSVQDDTEYNQEFRTIDNKGTLRWVIARGRVERDAEGDPAHFLGVIVDITDRKEAENELVEIRSMFDALFESTVMAIVMADLDGNILRANKTFLRTFGYTMKEFKQGITSKQITPLKSRAITEQVYEMLRLKGEAEPIEKEYIRKDGSSLPMLLGAAMIPGSNTQFMSFMLDISENKELKALNLAKDEFIGMASHQLRTPATVVKQYISLLKTGFAGPLSEKQQLYAEKAYASNERQLNIVNDLLKTAQIDSNRYILKKDHVSVSILVNDAIREMEDVLSQKGQTISFDNKIDGVKLYVDRTEINLILVNLIENASKYSPAESAIKVIALIIDNGVAISIADQGVGIAKDDQQRIFQKFTRIDNTLSDTVSGSGLGLYWVERIVKLHGGDITVSSKPRKGSTFVVSLPYDA